MTMLRCNACKTEIPECEWPGECPTCHNGTMQEIEICSCAAALIPKPALGVTGYEAFEVKISYCLLHSLAPELLSLLRQAGGVCKLFEQGMAKEYSHPDGSTVEVKGVGELIVNIEALLLALDNSAQSPPGIGLVAGTDNENQ